MIKKILLLTVLSSFSTGAIAHDTPAVDPTSPVDQDLRIRLPMGFSAHVFADEVGGVRHLVAHKSGWVYAALRKNKGDRGLLALKDTDGDGVADERRYFAAGLYGTGLALDGDSLYFGADQRLVKYTLGKDGLPVGEPVTLVKDFVINRQHDAKSLTLDGKGGVYVNYGVPSNACMEKMRTKGSKGMMPCPILENYGGVWKFDTNKTGQTQQDGEHYSTGHRNAVAIEWNKDAGDLYIAQHGRDALFSYFPQYFDEAASAELPSEEFHRVKKGADLGWPYSYYDHTKGARMVMPEYGGDGEKISDVGQKPLVGFPGHWAPNDLLFPSAKTGLPTGALIAFHGSWNRAPKMQAGYRVAFVPMNKKGEVTGDYMTFADGFASDTNEVTSPGKAVHRPMGLAEGHDGTLYIGSLMSGGRIWMVTHD